MKKEHCNHIYVTWGIECPPTIKKELDNILTRHSIDRVEDLCRKSEKEIMSIKDLTPYMRKKLKDFMNHYDLKFGMTMEEMNEYKDREYFLLHPEEKSLMNDNEDEEEKEKVFEQDVMAHISTDKKEEMEHVASITIGKDGMPVPEPHFCKIHEKDAPKRMDELERKLLFNYDPLVYLKPDEWEITFHSAAIRFMCHDTWLTKLFVSEEKRLKRAVNNAKKLYDMLRKDSSERSEKIRVLREKYKKEQDELRFDFPDLFTNKYH